MEIVENQYTISEWAIKTFGYPKSFSVLIDKLVEEVNELKSIRMREYGDVDAQFEDLMEECADIYIVLVQICNYIGFDLHECVDDKMSINRLREWKVFGDGTGHHIGE